MACSTSSISRAARGSACAASSTWTSARPTGGAWPMWSAARRSSDAWARSIRCSTRIRIPARSPAPIGIADGAGDLGVITSVSRPFCGDCTRARLGVDGKLYTCLFATAGIDLREPLRSGADDNTLRRIVADRWKRRDDRYSELRDSASRRVSASRCPTSAGDGWMTSPSWSSDRCASASARARSTSMVPRCRRSGTNWCAVIRPLAAGAGSIRAARNLGYCEWTTVVHSGDTIAFIPPVAGGSDDAPRCACGSPTLQLTSPSVIASPGRRATARVRDLHRTGARPQ